ncbi:MAG: serine hydrolase domain-containing protein [Gemmatimonadales bacterium]
MPRHSLALCAVLGLTTTLAAQQSTAERARGLVETVLAGDVARWRAYADSAVAPSAGGADLMARLGDAIGGGSVLDTQPLSDSTAAVTVTAGVSGVRYRVEVAVADGRITSVDRPRLAGPPLARATAEELAGLVARLAAADRFSGRVLVATPDSVLVDLAAGEASKEFAVPVTSRTRMALGSINKIFTAVAVLQLVEAGQLALSDPIGRHLEGILRDSVAQRITVQQLLTHTSGLGDFLFTPEMLSEPRTRFRSITDYLPRLADATPRFAPGTAWAYSNTGFLLLGALVEQASGANYDSYIREHVFLPAGMVDSDPVELDLVPEQVASGYDREYVDGAGRWRSDRYRQVVRVTPAGGGYSTPADLRRFVNALRTGRLLPPARLAEMLGPKPELGSPRYGFGAEMLAPGWVGHTGGGPGTESFVGFRPDDGTVVIVLANQQGETRLVTSAALQVATSRG